MRDEGGFDLVLDDGEEGGGAAGEFSGDDEGEVVWDVVGVVVFADCGIMADQWSAPEAVRVGIKGEWMDELWSMVSTRRASMRPPVSLRYALPFGFRRRCILIIE